MANIKHATFWCSEKIVRIDEKGKPVFFEKVTFGYDNKSTTALCSYPLAELFLKIKKGDKVDLWCAAKSAVYYRFGKNERLIDNYITAVRINIHTYERKGGLNVY